jgi:transcriptional regulator with XRE-family HTH domain
MPKRRVPKRRRVPRRTPPPVGDTYQLIGERLREIRLRKGLTQAEVGAPYFTKQHVSAIEGGRMAPAIKSLRHFGKVLGVPLRSLIPPGM